MRIRSKLTIVPPSAVNYAALEAATEPSGSSNPLPTFAGQRISFNGQRGIWYKGKSIDKTTTISESLNFAAAAHAIVFGWGEWKTSKRTGNQYRAIHDLALVAAGEVLSTRDEHGDMDKGLWPKNKFGMFSDPIFPFAVLPLYSEEDEFVHIDVQGIIAVNALNAFIRDFAIQGRMHEGHLPIVTLGSRSIMDGTKLSPELTIVDWMPTTDIPDVPDLYPEEMEETNASQYVNTAQAPAATSVKPSTTAVHQAAPATTPTAVAPRGFERPAEAPKAALARKGFGTKSAPAVPVDTPKAVVADAPEPKGLLVKRKVEAVA